MTCQTGPTWGRERLSDLVFPVTVSAWVWRRLAPVTFRGQNKSAPRDERGADGWAIGQPERLLDGHLAIFDDDGVLVTHAEVLVQGHGAGDQHRRTDFRQLGRGGDGQVDVGAGVGVDHHIRAGVYSWISDANQNSHLLEREVTLAEILKNRK